MASVVHMVVPVAAPDFPVDVSQRTLATPVLSLAVPRSAIELAVVATLVDPGKVMRNDGATVSFTALV